MVFSRLVIERSDHRQALSRLLARSAAVAILGARQVGMRSALHDLELSRLDVVHAGPDTFPLARGVRAVSAERLLSDISPLSRGGIRKR